MKSLINGVKFFLLLFVLFLSKFSAQLCGGSFGAPIFMETFGSVTNSWQVISPALVSPASTNYIYKSSYPPNDGEYTIANFTGTNVGWAWVNSADHTDDGSGKYGNMLIVNADENTAGEFYRRKVSGLCPNQVYRFSAWILNLITPGANQIKPDVTFRIENSSGVILGQISSGDLPETGKWTNLYLDFKSSITSGDVEVVLINNKKGGLGNDLAIDDISFSPCGPATTVSTSLDVFTTGVCDNSLGFQLTANISAGTYSVPNFIWQKSTDGGNTWIDLSSASTNNVLNVAAGSYQNNDLYRFIVGESTNISSPNCRVYSSNYKAVVHGYPSAPATKVFNFCQNSTGNSVLISAAKILWYTSSTGGIPDALPPNIDTSVLGSKDYWITETVNGCESSRSKITINILPNPNAPLVSDYQFCQNSAATILSATGTNLLWYSSSTGGTGSSVAPTPSTSQSGVFSYWVSQNNGTCESARAEIKVTILPAPYSDSLHDTSICDGETIILDAGSGFDNYEWDTVPKQYSQKIDVTSPGIYSVKLTGSNGCSATQSVEVVAGVTPTITNIKSGENFLEIYAEGGNPPYLYSLDNVNWQTSNVFPNLKAAIYEVFVKSQINSCTAIANSAVLFIPNVITPNQDGYNDVWKVKNIEYFSKAKLSIYDRFGKKVFHTEDVSKFNWDGFYLGRTLPSDTYWYVLEIENNYTRTGWILLKTRK